MITASDLNKLSQIFVTKQDLEALREEVATKEELRQVVTAVDGVLKEVKAMREEQTAHYQQHEDNNQEYKEFKNRLTKLESIPVI